MGHSRAETCRRLGLHESRHRTVRYVLGAVGREPREVRSLGREVRTNTEAAVVAAGYDPADAGALWGVGRPTVMRRLRREVGYGHPELQDGALGVPDGKPDGGAAGRAARAGGAGGAG